MCSPRRRWVGIDDVRPCEQVEGTARIAGHAEPELTNQMKREVARGLQGQE